MSRGGRVQTGALSSLAACFFVSGLLRAGEVVAALPALGEAGAGQVAEQPQTLAEANVPDLGALATALHRQRADLLRGIAGLRDRYRLIAAQRTKWSLSDEMNRVDIRLLDRCALAALGDYMAAIDGK